MDIVDFGGMGFVIRALGDLTACVQSDKDIQICCSLIMMMVQEQIYIYKLVLVGESVCLEK